MVQWSATLSILGRRGLPCHNQIQLFEIMNDFLKKVHSPKLAQQLKIQVFAADSQRKEKKKERGRSFVLGQVDALHINFDYLWISLSSSRYDVHFLFIMKVFKRMMDKIFRRSCALDLQSIR